LINTHIRKTQPLHKINHFSYEYTKKRERDPDKKNTTFTLKSQFFTSTNINERDPHKKNTTFTLK